MDALALAVAVISALIALAALARDNKTRRLLQRTVLAPDLRPLLEATRDALGSIVAAGGSLTAADKDAVDRADRRLPELLPGIIDAQLRTLVDELADNVRKVFASGRGGGAFFAWAGDETISSITPEDRAAWERTADAARNGQEVALEALKRLSQIQAGS